MSPNTDAVASGPVVTAIVPARGGSKGLPGKNLSVLGGRTLLTRTTDALRSAGANVVIVTTDDDRIAQEASKGGCTIVERPADLASDSASSESALLHAMSTRSDLFPDDGVTVFAQCTSPFVDPALVRRSIERVVAGEADVSFSAVPFHGFIWTPTDGSWGGVNHESNGPRQRRQDRPVEALETGAFYTMRTAGFLEYQNRFFGVVEPAYVEPLHAIEIDSPTDLEIARRLAEVIDSPGLSSIDPASVHALVMDFDGVHTNNCASVDLDGREYVRVNRSDGMGLDMLRQSGLPMIIISTERNPVVAARAAKLGIECIQGCDDKLDALRAWLARNSIAARNTMYIGNDINDSSCLELVGFPVVVADAHFSVRHLARYVTSKTGGNGAIREITDLLLTSRS